MVDFTDVKSWFTSKTIWAGIGVVVPSLFMFVGYTVTAVDVTELETAVASLFASISGVIAIYGRVSATKSIGSGTA